MPLLGDVSDYVTLAPLAFGVGVLVGLGLASRYRIVRARTPPLNRVDDDRADDG